MPSSLSARQHIGGRLLLTLSFSSSAKPQTLDCLQPAAAFLPQQPAAEGLDIDPRGSAGHTNTDAPKAYPNHKWIGRCQLAALIARWNSAL